MRFEITNVAGEKRTLTVPARAGVNRVEWNMRFDPTAEQLEQFKQAQAAGRGRQGGGGGGGGGGRGRGGNQGPQGDPALPGEYLVKMTANGKTYTSRITVREDPMLTEAGARRTTTAPGLADRHHAAAFDRDSLRERGAPNHLGRLTIKDHSTRTLSDGRQC